MFLCFIQIIANELKTKIIETEAPRHMYSVKHFSFQAIPSRAVTLVQKCKILETDTIFFSIIATILILWLTLSTRHNCLNFATEKQNIGN